MLSLMFSDAVIDEMLNKYGKENQSVILIEEMSELTKELVKNIRGKDNYDCLVEEMAHVMLSLSVVARVLDIRNSDLRRKLHKKFHSMDVVGHFTTTRADEYCLDTEEDVIPADEVPSIVDWMRKGFEESEKSVEIGDADYVEHINTQEE